MSTLSKLKKIKDPQDESMKYTDFIFKHGYRLPTEVEEDRRIRDEMDKEDQDEKQ